VRLKSLRLFGFKTFADQTELVFEPGITALVGPNGSGKSNIVDAIRWALGEQSAKSLRSTKTEDVIFAGNDKRKPLGMAEVSLTFENDDGALAVDFNEVQITRRAYRAGESEFYVNRSQVRLRDIHELFMGTGLGPGSYSIVSQGQIDAILVEKPTERRSLFEETAGISKFLARKAETLRRLEQTEQNGIRISDLIGELAARIPELETQVRRARRYRRASARLRDLEILTYLRSTATRRAERERLRIDFERLEGERVAAANRATRADADLGAARTQVYAVELSLDERRGAATAARARLADVESQQAALAARRDVLVERLETEIAALGVESLARDAAAAMRAREVEGVAGEVATLEQRLAESEAQVSQSDERMGAMRRMLDGAQAIDRSASSELAGAEARLHTIEELEANLEGHVAGTRVVLQAQQRNELTGIVGVVANLIRVDEKYARALDIAFGAALSNIVTETSEDAERAIAYLSQRELGRATFLPLDTLGARTGRDPASAPKVPGVIGYAHTLVHSAPEYAGIVAFLVGRILIVESMRIGIEIVRGANGTYREGIVTLEGDQITGGGAMTGGRYKRERSILSRRAQAEALRREIPVLRTALDRSAAEVRTRADELAVAIEAHDGLRRLANEAALALVDLRGRVAALTAERDRLLNEAQSTTALMAERSSEAEELRTVSEHVAGAEAALNEARAAVAAADRAVDAARAERDALTERTTRLETELRNAQNDERTIARTSEEAHLRLAEIEAELGMLAASFAQNPATEDECTDVESRYVKEDGDFTPEVARLREELGRLANVNLNAEQEREEVAQREAFLREQLDDLAKARETLIASIAEIESSSQAQFNETFMRVKRAFEGIFPRLFPGGEAKMWQTNPESLSETGIEIAVQPPGKKMTALAALSGGERAMTAAALIFALIEVRPSPFYLLDEVDAALDDANVDRFSAMVREVAGAAQLVLVTHNKKTMELADRLYGITMAEPGASTIIGVDLSPAEAEEEALAG
jgi:chromosome segregation protein